MLLYVFVMYRTCLTGNCYLCYCHIATIRIFGQLAAIWEINGSFPVYLHIDSSITVNIGHKTREEVQKLGNWRDDRYAGGKKEMENGTFARRPHRLQWITDKAREKWWDEQCAEYSIVFHKV